MNKVICKLSNRKGIPTGALFGKYKHGRIFKQRKGPRKTKFLINNYDLNITVHGTSKDNKYIIGDCIIKYDVEPRSYLSSLNSLEESVKDIEKAFSKEISYDLSGLISRYDSSEITSEEAKNSLEFALEERTNESFFKKGITPYKITSSWKVSENIFSIPEINEEFNSAANTLREKAHSKNFDEILEDSVNSLCRKLSAFSLYPGIILQEGFKDVLRLMYQRATLDPYKIPSKYVSASEAYKIIENSENKGLGLLLKQTV